MPLSARPTFLKKLDFFEDPFHLYRCFKGEGPSVLLESARVSKKIGRYSLIAKNPFLIFESKVCYTKDGRPSGCRIQLHSQGTTQSFQGDPFETLRGLLKEFAPSSLPSSLPAGRQGTFDLPPFTGGAIGYFAYETKNILEPSLSQKAPRHPTGQPRRMTVAPDDLGLPDIYLLFLDEGLVLDHEKRSLYLFADPRKAERLEEDLRDSIKTGGRRKAEGGSSHLPSASVESSLTRAEFIERVGRAKSYIQKGDIYQANLSQRFSFEINETGLSIYERLREINPSCFFGILDAGSFQIVSGSPERLIKLQDGVLETRPIAGTRSRGKTPTEDAALSRELILNEKERAEHIMLLDLERNDLGRVSEYGSVRVDELMVIEDYSHVKHIVSNVRGVLRKGLDAVDVLKALFPGGTITGAPKVRCMEVIDELEPVARGPYTGSLGYFSFTGNMDFNIIIRSLVVKDKKAYLHVGAGIVADSDPEKEYDETLYKAEAIFSAFFGQGQARPFFEERRVTSKVS